MRPIKFRAWVKELEVFRYDFVLSPKGDVFWWDGNNELQTWKFDMGQAYLQQFTGLCDKSGKEIYEGDILKVVENDEYKGKEIVEWNNEMTGFDPFIDYAVMSICPISGSGVYSSDCEVIGNIYENPELRKGK